MLKLLRFLKKRLFLPLIAIGFLIMAFIVDSPKNIFTGYLKIIQSPSILITDYIYVGGLGATLFNVSTILTLNIVMVYFLKLRVSGPIFAGLMTIAGFSFFGKNILNTLPIYLGIYLYSLKNHTKFKNSIIVVLFSTGISPIVSYLIFGINLELYLSIPLGIVVGCVIGFILPSIASNTIKIHGGYNLFNVGFALGIISLVATSIIKAFDVPVELAYLVSKNEHYTLLFMLLGISTLFICAAVIDDIKEIKKYPNILKRTGRLITDFIRDNGIDATLFNCGIVGLICFIIIAVTGIEMNGPVIGVCFTVIGFAAYGIHARNAIPVMIGAVVTCLLMGLDFSNPSVAMCVILVTGLAPISGNYGCIVGFVIGMIHVSLATNPYVCLLQGGFDLYNNGFVAGFVAALAIPVLEMFKEE